MLHFDLLALRTTHELRFIATQLQLRHRQGNRADWLTAIHHYWCQPATLTHALAGLSLPACRALWRLVQVPALPAHLLCGDFGPIQQTGRRRVPRAGKPAQTSQSMPSPMQELYNLGLLFAVDGTTLEQASHWAVPDDLRPPLRAWLDRQVQRWQQQPLSPLTVSSVAPSTFTLLHDLCQVLAFARQQPQALRHPNRFPTVAYQKRLHPCLLTPTGPANEPGWLRFLGQLATAAGLLCDGMPRPWLWDWLRQPAAEQLRSLWQTWLDLDATTLSHLFQQPSLAGIEGWRTALVELAAEQAISAPTPFSAADLCHRLLLPTNQPQPHLYWFTQLSTIDAQFDALLQAYLLPWGIVEITGQQAAPFLRPVDADTLLPTAAATAEVCYQFTELGRFLLLPQAVSALGWQWQREAGQWLASIFDHPTRPAPHSAEPAVVWTLIQHRLGDPEARLLIAPFCAASALVAADPAHTEAELLLAPGHRLTITTHSLALAASQGYGMADLWHFVQHSRLVLRPSDWKALQHALDAGTRIALRPALLLQTENAELMRQIQQTTPLQPFLDELLTPTLATWQGDRASWIAQLQKAGFFPFLAADDATANGLATAGAAPDEAPVTLALPVAEAAVLWLALQVYERVGRYVALPLRAAPTTIQHLLATLAATQQGSLLAQLQAIEAALASAIDQLPFLPPKAPTDPATWHLLIEQAIDQHCDLNLLHWSAGRGLAVQRRVTPFYIDEQRFGGPALRAWCHASGRDLWFRLDRIQAATLL